jgi:ribosomal protein L12E/L44/L45/RPP1/RPP2
MNCITSESPAAVAPSVHALAIAKSRDEGESDADEEEEDEEATVDSIRTLRGLFRLREF